MAFSKRLVLSESERAVLEQSARHGPTHRFRQRCLMVLLKSDPAVARSSADVAVQLGCCEPIVNTWLARYEADGLDGLRHKKGAGRPAILQRETDFETVRRAVQANRQRVSLAKAALEKELDKGFSTATLKRFLKKTIAASNDCESE